MFIFYGNSFSVLVIIFVNLVDITKSSLLLLAIIWCYYALRYLG